MKKYFEEYALFKEASFAYYLPVTTSGKFVKNTMGHFKILEETWHL
jgi:hypothetical protein